MNILYFQIIVCIFLTSVAATVVFMWIEVKRELENNKARTLLKKRLENCKISGSGKGATKWRK